tara:strand:- start:60 stop:494 length:435 start_codon:yes stop_codon:yes gene_type:complete
MKVLLAMALATATFDTPLVHIDVSKYQIPYFIGNRPVRTITCHKALAKPLIAAIQCVRKQEMHLGRKLLINHAGCYVHRRIHGSTQWSNHRWGTAIDINVTQPVSKLTNNQDPALVKCFKDQGFTWGGDWKSKDYMHFEMDIQI